MSNHRLAFLVLLGLSASALASAASPPDVRVLSTVPSTAEANAHDLRGGVQIAFDQDVINFAEVGPVVTGALSITPAATGEARWIDRRTLVFFPKPALQPSTTYSVQLDPKLAARIGGKVPAWPGLRFVYERIRLTRVSFEGNESYQPLQPTVHVNLSQPAFARSLAQACRFCPAGVAGTVDCVAATPAFAEAKSPQPITQLSVKAEKALRPQSSYVFRCDAGLAPATGDATLVGEFTRTFTTYGPAKLAKVEPSGNDVASDNVHVSLTFTTPVEPAKVRDHVELVENGKTAVPIDLSGRLGRTVYAWSGNLTIASAYEIRIKPGLKDIFGQEIAAGTVGGFQVGDASPKLRMEKGIFLVERSSGQYPVWSRNLDALQVRCAEVPESRLSAVLTGPMNYDAWWDASRGQSVDYQNLKLKPREKTLHLRGARNQWHDTSLDLRALCGSQAKTGVYMIETSAPGDPAHAQTQRSLASVTDLGLVAKVGNASSLVWVVSLSTGRPVADAAVRIRDTNGKLRFEGKTNADGVVQGPGAGVLADAKPKTAPSEEAEEYEGGVESYRASRVLVTAEAEGDFAVLDTNWNNGVQIWNFGVAQDRTGGKLRVRGFLHSDRGLYRPGDLVHLKGLVRFLDTAGKMAVPDKKRRVHLIVTDPRNKNVVDQNLAISEFGGFHKDVLVADESALGDYQVQASIEGQTFRDHFSVEEYRPRTFEVKVKTGKKDVLIGQPLRFDVNANFLYGAPLHGGKLTYSVRRRQHLPDFGAGFQEYVFQDYASQYDNGEFWARYEERSFSELVSDGELELDGKGAAHVTVKDKDRLKVPQDYVFEATVVDATGESVSAGQMVIGHKSNLYLGLHPSEFVQAVDMPFGIQVVGFDKEGSRRAATAELEIVPRRYDCGPHGNNGYWSCDRIPAKEPAIRRTVAVPESGSAAVERVVLKEPGEYVVRVSSDGKGENAVASEVIWVVGKGEAFWSGDEGDRMTVIASKTKYVPGDTALLVPQAQMPGALALVTLERDGIMSYAVKSLTSSGQPLEVKVTPDMAPNVFASVVMVRGRDDDGRRRRPRFKMGLVDLKVESAVQRLSVAVSTERPSYQPGEEVKATVRVTAASGEPVRAELALAAADEGVLQIVGFKTPDPMAAFYAPFGLGVESATTWNRLLRKIDPNHDDEEEGGDGGGDEAGRIRSRFMATAFWAPALTTDEDGRVEVSFKAPDNLTAFRLMAVAADKGTRFGSGDQRFAVAKPLQLLSALPRFMSPGDHVQAAVAIHNNTDQKLDVSLTAEMGGAGLQGTRARKVGVGAHAFRRVAFDVTARRDGLAKFVFRAEAADLKDAVEARIPVHTASTPETLMVAEGSTSSKATHDLPAIGQVIPGGGLEIALDRSGMGQLDEGLAYLVGYPYGCLEQTTSKVVPMIAISELARNARLPGLDVGQARKFIEMGIAKIIRHQHEDGGFGLWMGAPPEVQYTATGLWGLSVAKAAGFSVDDEALQKGATYLRGHSDERGHGSELFGEWGNDAFAAYVLASLGRSDAGTLAHLFEKRASLPIYGRAFLLRALLAAKRSDLAKVLTGELVALAPESGLVHEMGGELGWYWSSDLRTSALVVWALLAARPGDPRVARLAEALLKARVQGRWGNTQENVFGLLALAELAKARASDGQVAVTVRLGDRVVAKKIIAAKNVDHISVPLAKLGRGPLSITAKGGEIFYSARIRVLRPVAPASVDRGLAVEREYLDPADRTPVHDVHLGQEVLVKLKVTSPVARAHVALVDRLPAGFEPVIQRFANADDWRQANPPSHWSNNWSTYWQNEELRDDRMQIFADTLAQGTSEHEYMVRAASTGKFVAPPASAEAMYDPGAQGWSASGSVEIVK